MAGIIKAHANKLASQAAHGAAFNFADMGQNLATASGLIGKNIDALDDEGNAVKGKVDRVTVKTDPKDENKREIRVHVGATEVQLKNVREILS